MRPVKIKKNIPTYLICQVSEGKIMKIVQYWCLTARPSAPPWDYNKTHLSSPVPTAASHLSKALKLRSCQTHFDLHDRKWECCTYFSSADADNDLPAPCVHIPKRDTRLTFIICADQTRDTVWCQSIVWLEINRHSHYLSDRCTLSKADFTCPLTRP